MSAPLPRGACCRARSGRPVAPFDPFGPLAGGSGQADAADVEGERAGLARGGSLDNAIVIGSDRVLNREGLRYADEFVRHKLLDAVGYRKGTDGYRTDPSGKPVTIVLTSEPQAISREYDELWKKSLDAIGIRMEVQ